MAVTAKLRQLAGQTQDNFNFGPSLLKGVFSKSSGKMIVAPIFCFSSYVYEILAPDRSF